MSQVDNPRLLWHDPKEWMVRVLARLETENELVEQIRIFHGVEEGAAEISYEAACQLPFPKLVIQPKLSDVRGDVRALFRVTELIAKKIGLSESEIDAACASPPASDDEEN